MNVTICSRKAAEELLLPHGGHILLRSAFHRQTCTNAAAGLHRRGSASIHRGCPRSGLVGAAGCGTDL